MMKTCLQTVTKVLYLAVQLSLLLGMLSVFGLRQQRIQTVNQLLPTRLLVFALGIENNNNIRSITAQ